MKYMRKIWTLVICVMVSFVFLGGTAFADETQTSAITEENADGGCRSEWSVDLVDWHRRIYVIGADILYAENVEAEAIKMYAGLDYHIVDSEGKVLNEGAYIDAAGNAIDDPNGGKVCRDKSGWYVLWETPEMANWGKHSVYVQANTDFIGGNNQSLGVEGLDGIYESAGDKKPYMNFGYSYHKINVAAEVDATDVHIPVLQGCDVESVDFLNKATVKMEAVYGELRDIPIKVQWYRVTTDDQGTELEKPVGDVMTSVPYHIPESELPNLSEASTYRVKVFYAGDPSSEDAKKNTNGYENVVSNEVVMDEAIFEVELVKGHIDITVQLEQVPYNNRYTANTFSYRLYHFDKPNQVIQEDTPYTVYSVTFDMNDNQTTKHLHITDLSAGWYTIVPETLEGDFEEMLQERSDNNEPVAHSGSSAGIDFYIGDIMDNKYSWEIIRYQGQDVSDPLGDNYFRVTYSYRETVYGINYMLNLPEGVQSNSIPPMDQTKYRAGTKVNVKSGSGMTADGWQFVGWSLKAGDGIYSGDDVLYSDMRVHDIPVETRVTMDDDGITLYAQWIAVYEVNYHGNTSTGGTLPVDTKGTVKAGTNVYYEGDTVTVLSSGDLEKIDADGTRYIFDGWSVNQDGSGERLSAGNEIRLGASDVTFYAQWKVFGTDKYAVNYIVVVPEGGNVTGEPPEDPEKYADGNVVKVKGQESLQMEHYRFAGWSLTSREDGIYQSGEEIFGTNDIGHTVTKEEAVMKEQGLSFYSRWIPLYQVVYHANSGVTEGVPVDAAEYEANDMVTILSGDEMVRPGYQFIGWNTALDGSGESYDVGLKFNMPEENIELYAQWEKIPESETESEEADVPAEPKAESVWPLVILAMIGTACITAYVVYQIMSHRKE